MHNILDNNILYQQGGVKNKGIVVLNYFAY